jgi:hypothetical protein
MNSIVIALLVLNVCHWIGDFTHASRPWMLAAKRTGTPLLPILSHAVVHTLLMAVACFAIWGADAAIIAAAIQLPTHFAIDVLKGRVNVWFPSVQSSAAYPHWYVFGADQFLHQVVIIFIASSL